MNDSTAKPANSQSSMIDSRELLRRIRGGDSSAADRLFERYLPILSRWAHRRVPVRARGLVETADVVQDTFLKTFKHLKSFEATRDGALLHYLRRALVNRIRDQVRYVVRHPEFATVAEDQGIEPGASPFDTLADKEQRGRYTSALTRLRAEDRSAIVGRLDLDYSYEQLALVLGKATPGAARLAVRRALIRLAHEMQHG